MNLNLKQEDFRFITIGLLPAFVVMYFVYYLAYYLWWLPFVVAFLPLSYGIGVTIEPNVYVGWLQIKTYLKKALDKQK